MTTKPSEIKKGLTWTNRFGLELKVYRVSQAGQWAHVGANHIHANVSQWELRDVLASIHEGKLRAIVALCDAPHFDTSRKYKIAELALEAIALLSK